MDLKQIIILTLQISIVATVFGFGLRATLDDLLYVVRRPRLFARSLIAMLVVMPVIAIILARNFDFPRNVEIALVTLAISPAPPLLPNRERSAGALISYGLGLIVTIGLLSIVLVPLSMALIGWIFGVPLGVSPAAVAPVMLMMLVGPIALGVAVRRWRPDLAARIAGPITTVALVLLLIPSLLMLVAAAPIVWRLVGNGTVLALSLFVAIGLAVGHLFGGPDPEHAAVLALSTACRHPVLAMTIASSNFPDERFGGVIVLYLLVNMILSIPYIVLQKRRVATAAPAA
jgi:bile acid:Na+ symporter, BASS family